VIAKENLSAIYLELPRIACAGKCQDSCGPVPMSRAEERHFRLAGADVPDVLAMLRSGNLACPHLDPFGRCSVYAIRPMICRLWGMVEKMRCPHGCTPERWLSDGEAREFLLRVDRVVRP
jgi:hypothetical protein